MELIGTVLYFSKKSKDVSEIKRLVNTVKPHFSVFLPTPFHSLLYVS